MRRDIRPPRVFRKPLATESQTRPSPPEPLGSQRPPSRSRARLVRFPCGHTDSGARLAGRLRERKSALWVCCPECNVIAVAIAIIEPP